MSTINAGTARVDITPTYPIALGGFGQRTTDSVGTHDPLFGKAIYLSDGREHLLWITTDLLSIPGQLTAGVLEGITQKTGLESRQICLCASHTHSGPAIRGWHLVETDSIRRYMGALLAALIDVGVRAVAYGQASRLRVASGKVDFQINRRTRGHPNIVDDRLFALSVEDPDTGSSKAVLFGVGCHPVCVGYENYLMCADYPGYAQRYIESQFPTANALFFNMAQGNMIPSTRKPTNSMDPRGYDGASFDSADTIGGRLAHAVLEALRDAPAAETLDLLSSRGTCQVRQNHYDLTPEKALKKVEERRRVIAQYLGEDYFAGVTPENLSPLKSIWSDACRLVVEENMDDDRMIPLLSSICQYRVYLNRALNPAPVPLDVPVQVMGINEYLFLALPGEVLIEVAFDWKQRTNSDRSYIVALANDAYGYLPHSTNFEEPNAEVKYETIMNALEPQAMDLAVQKGCQMVAAAGGRSC